MKKSELRELVKECINEAKGESEKLGYNLDKTLDIIDDIMDYLDNKTAPKDMKMLAAAKANLSMVRQHLIFGNLR